MTGTLPLFGDAGLLPDGFLYRPGFLTSEEEREVLDSVRALEFGRFVMRGVEARRRIVHLGWRYGFDTRSLQPGPPLPAFAARLRERVGALTGRLPEQFAEALVTEYPAGAAIGWHRDAPPFGMVVGISLGAACRFRFRRGVPGARETRQIALEPGSVYVLDGPARSEWEHSIPPVSALRYSITFRTLRVADARALRPG